MGGKTQTSTQQVQIPPEVMARYNAVNARAEDTAQQPFQQYGGQFVAPLNQQQQAGVANINNAANSAMPFYGAAAGLTLGGTGAVNPGDLQTQRYMNPFTQAVADPTYAALRQQQAEEMQGATGNAIRNGAFGGDRAGLVAANLARQQQLGTAQAMAPIYQQGYTQAQGVAQQQQGVQLGAEQANLARQMQGGQQLAGLGAGMQQSQLAGAQAQLGAGTLEQQTQQADLSAKYQQFLQERGYPFQVAQFLANIAMGTGALSGSTTTTTQPAPFFSDERDKTNVQPLGKGLYAYDYKADVEAARESGAPMPPKRVGPMAQDMDPDRVSSVGGHKVVDLDRSEYAPGGLVGDGELKQLLAMQQQFLGPYTPGQGGPYGGQSQGKQSYVPAASLPVGQLKTAGGLPQQRPSGFAEAASMGSQIGGLLKDAKGLYDWGSSKLSGLSSGKPEGNLGDEWTDRPRYAMGGVMPYGNDGDDIMDGVVQAGQQQPIQPLKPATPPAPTSSGLKEVVDIAKMFAAFAMKDGGRVGLAYGGEPDLPAEGASETGLMPTFRVPDEYAPIIERASRETGIPAAIIAAKIKRESGFNPNARGGVGEVGISQIRPSTARDPGFGLQPETGDLRDPNVAIPFGARYLKARGDAAGVQDWSNAAEAAKGLAGYNGAGPAARRYAQSVLAFTRDDGMPGPGLSGAPATAERAEPTAGRGSRPTPGLAGPGYIDETPQNSPFKFFADKMLAGRDIEPGTKSALTSENLWIPALSGIGSMLASRSPWLGNALGEGLVGGSKAYTALNKQQQDMAESRGRTETQMAQLANNAFTEVGGRLMVRVQDPRTGAYKMITSAEYRSNPAYKIDPRVPPEVMERFAQEARQQDVPATPAGPQPGPGAPAPGKVETTELTPPKVAPKAPAAPKTSEVEKPSGIPAAIELAPEDRKEAFERAYQMENEGTAAKAEALRRDMFGPQRAVAASAEQARLQMMPLAKTIMSLPEGKSLGTSGPASAALQPYVATLNNLMEMATGKKGAVIDPAVLANQEEAKKLIARIEAQTTSDSGQRAVEAMKRISEGLVNLTQSKTGQKQILANVFVNTQREIDRDRYFADWVNAGATKPGAEVSGTFSESAKLTSEYASRNFDRRYNNAYYQTEEQSLKKMMDQRVKDPTTGQPVSAFEYVAANGANMSAEQIAQIKQRFGPAILRYFGING